MSTETIGLDYKIQLLENILSKLDITLTQLRNDIRGTDNRTLTNIYDRLANIGKLTFDTSNYLYIRIGASDVSLGGGPAQLQVKDSGGTWTDVGYATGNLDVPISIQTDNVGLAKETTVSGIKSQTDKLTFDASNYLFINIGTDSAGIAKDSTLSGIKSQTDKLNFDTSNYLYINIGADSVGIAKDSTLSGFSGKFPSAASLSDSLSNPTTTIVGSAILGWDGSYWRRVAVDSSSRLRAAVETLPSLPSGTNIIGGVFADHGTGTSINQQVGTTEVTGSVVDVTRRGRKIIYMKNTQDVDVTITIEGSYDGSDWYTIRSGISLSANGGKKIGILTDPYGYIRAKAVASASPSTGSVLVVVESLT